MLHQEQKRESELTSSYVRLAVVHKAALNIICDQIKEKDSKNISEENLNVLYSLFGDTLFKALELLDRDSIELVTITNTNRKYFLVNDQGSYYTLYMHIHFCKCDQYKNSLKENKINNMCSHILACELAFALGSYSCASMKTFGIQPLDDLAGF